MPKELEQKKLATLQSMGSDILIYKMYNCLVEGFWTIWVIYKNREFFSEYSKVQIGW